MFDDPDRAGGEMDTQLRVLVVDDSKVMRGIIRKMLAAKGVDVLEAVDGKDAMRVLETESVSCSFSCIKS